MKREVAACKRVKVKRAGRRGSQFASFEVVEPALPMPRFYLDT